LVILLIGLITNLIRSTEIFHARSPERHETPKPDPNKDNGKILGQPYGRESWKVLEGKTSGEQVKLDILDIDRYRRMVSIVWVGNRNINLEMVREGYAEAYKEYLKKPYRSQFLAAQREARLAKRGIWGLGKYERPSDFRKRLKKR
jgi:endonuclease YncB( thermonuclease family)